MATSSRGLHTGQGVARQNRRNAERKHGKNKTRPLPYHQVCPPTKASLASSEDESPAMQTVVRSVQLQCALGTGQKRKFTSANNLPHPTTAEIRWSSTRRDNVELQFLASGQGRDVFSATGARYVLKLQRGQFHESSNKREAMLAETSLNVFLPEIYGTVLTTLEDQDVSVLVVERVPHDALGVLSPRNQRVKHRGPAHAARMRRCLL